MLWLKAALAFVLILGLLFAVKVVTFRYLRRLAASTRTDLDDILIRTLSGPIRWLLVAVALALAGPFLPMSGDSREYARMATKVILILAGMVLADRIGVGFFQRRRIENEAIRTSSGLIRVLIHVLVYGLGGLMILDSVGVSITPLLASLGIGSLAVALALQETLSNFFAGIYLGIDRPLEVGHYVKLESGEEGYVEKIGWRSTKIRMLPNNTVIVPNSKLASAHFTNYYLPEKELAVLVGVEVSYDSDLRKVEAVTVDVARTTLREVKGGIPSFEPFIRYHTFGESGIGFSVILRAAEYVDQYLLKHEFIKRLHERYRAEGIVIPFPIRTLDLPESLSVTLNPR